MTTRDLPVESLNSAVFPGSIRSLAESWELSLRAANKAPKTIAVYREAVGQLAKFLEEAGMPTDVEHVTREHIEAYILSLYDSGKSPATVSNRHRALQQYFKWLRREDEVSANPMQNMEVPDVPEKMVPVLAEEQLKALLKTTDGNGFIDVRDRALLYFLIDTGLRRSEVGNLKVEDIDRRKMTARIVRKGRREDLAPIGRKALAALDKYMRARDKWIRGRQERFAGTDALWIGYTGPLSGSGVAQMVERRGNEAGIKGLHAHQLRHTRAHHWLADDGSETDLMHLMGWKSPQMLRRYGASAANERARAAHSQHSLGDKL
jgi:site-specific recombinase XerD